MSQDSKYIIQLEGPFGNDELENVVKALQDTTPSFGFKVWAYDTIQGETKWARDEEVVAAAKLSSPIQILRRRDDERWEVIWDIKDEKSPPRQEQLEKK